VSQPDYQGPLVARLGGADISWLIGWIVSAGTYLLLMRATATSDTAAGRLTAVSADRLS
jgi:NCS1 family nucleobase:cation symporter-1